MSISCSSADFDVQAISPIGNKTMRVCSFHYLQESDTEPQGTANVCILPRGKIRVFPGLCRIIPDEGDTAAELSVGFAQHLDSKGRIVDADSGYFLEGYLIDDSPAPVDLADNDEDFADFETGAGLTLTVTIAAGDLPQGSEIKGYFNYVFLD